MKKTTRICVLLTGGTFLSKKSKKGGQAPIQEMAEFEATRAILEEPLRGDESNIHVEWRWVMAKDSSRMVKDDWYQIAAAVHQAFKDGFHSVVVVHGTDTMEYSAGALLYLMSSSNQAENRLPGFVVFTGAMKSVFTMGSDAALNFQNAVEAAIWGHENDIGDVAIVFGGRMFPAARAAKEDPYAFDAFRAPALAHLSREYFDVDGVHADAKRYRTKALWLDPTPPDRKLPGGVLIVELEPGLEGAELEAIVKLETVQTLILAAPGDGNVADAFHGALELATELDKPIVVVSNFQGRTVKLATYDVGIEAVKKGAIPGNDLTHIQASLKSRMLLSLYQPHFGSRVTFFKDRIPKPMFGEVTLSKVEVKE